MASDIYAVLTNRGAVLEAQALATGVPVRLKFFAVGDGGAQSVVVPDPARTELINEKYRGEITSATSLENQVVFELRVPGSSGGYTIREVGIFTEAGELYSIARSPDVLKPTESNGAVVSVTYKYTLAVANTSTVTVVLYDDYLTPAQADSKYLKITEKLSEIKTAGAAAQKKARENIGIDLDNYNTKEQVDNKIANAGYVKKVNNSAPDANGNVNVGTVKKVNNTGPDAGGNVNVGTVKSINGTSPDANGNVNINVSSGISNMQLGAMATYQPTGNEVSWTFKAPSGCVITGLIVQETGQSSADNIGGLYYKPIQKYVNGAWVTIAG